MPSYLLDNEESERLLFRKVNPTDFDLWLTFHEDPRSSQYWKGLPKDPRVACTEQFSRNFERYEEKSGGMNALVSKEDNMLIGLAGVLLQTVNNQQEFEIGYSILPKYRRQGYAFEAAEKCKVIAFNRDWTKSLISIIQMDNVPSQKTALKNGMHLDFATTYHANPVYIFRVIK